MKWRRANRLTRDVYIVLISGELAWEAERNDWDWERTTSLLTAAKGMFAHDPLWVDLTSVKEDGVAAPL